MALPPSINFRSSQIDAASLLTAAPRPADMSDGSERFDRHLSDARRRDERQGDRSSVDRRDDQRRQDRADAARQARKTNEDNSVKKPDPKDEATQTDGAPAPVAVAIPVQNQTADDAAAGTTLPKDVAATPSVPGKAQAASADDTEPDDQTAKDIGAAPLNNGAALAGDAAGTTPTKAGANGKPGTDELNKSADLPLAAHLAAASTAVHAQKPPEEPIAPAQPAPALPAHAALALANSGAKPGETPTDNADGNSEGTLAIQPKEGLGHQAASHMAEKSDAKAADASPAGTPPAQAATNAAVAAAPTTFAKAISEAAGTGTSSITGVTATDQGGTARLSDIQNIGNGTQNPSSNTVTVRIGTLPGQTQPTQIPAMTIALQIARNLQKGVNQFDIRLDPAEMGRIDVRMEVHRDGKVAAHLTVDRPETLDLLQRDARSLQQALSDAGLQANADSLNFSLRDQNAGGNTAGFGGNSSHSSQPNAPAAPAEAIAAPTYNINLAANGGVDIRV